MVRSARVTGLNVAGVDLLRSNHGPVVMEFNSTSGLECIEKAAGRNAADMVIEYIEKNAKLGKAGTWVRRRSTLVRTTLKVGRRSGGNELFFCG